MIIRYHNARLIDAMGDRFGDLYVENGLIRYCGEASHQFSDRTVDVGGNAILPAFIDLHCHLRDPGYPQKEDMETGMRAALKGGYALLCAMANTDPVISTPELVEQNLEKARRLKLCKLIQAAAAGENLEDCIATNRAALAKVTSMLTNDGKTIFSDDFMRQLLLDSKRYGFLISTHCQPERQIVARDIALLRETGGNLHIGHISLAETAELVRKAKAEGLPLTCEVTPHHLFGYDDDYKVNPPLRTKADLEALIEGIMDGTVDCLSTDHAPHTPEDKRNGMAGISNIEYAIGIFLSVFHEHSIPLTRLAELTSYAPARRLKIKAGLLAPGYPADIVILNTVDEHEIKKDDMISKSHNTPFEGRKVRGRVLQTIVEGETRYEYGQAL